MMTLTQGSPNRQQPQNAAEAAVWRAIDVGKSEEAILAAKRLRAAARRALRRPAEVGLDRLKVFGALSVIDPIMRQEAEALLPESCRLAARDLLSDPDVHKLLDALEAFLDVHRGPAVDLRA